MVSVGGPFPFSLENVADIVVTRLLPAQVLAPLEALGSVWVWKEADEPIPPEVFAEQCGEGTGAPLHAHRSRRPSGCSTLAAISKWCPRWRSVSTTSTCRCRERGIVIGHTPDVLTETVADSAFALLAAVVRRLPEGEREVRSGRLGYRGRSSISPVATSTERPWHRRAWVASAGRWPAVRSGSTWRSSIARPTPKDIAAATGRAG
jgi:hypothetical protein